MKLLSFLSLLFLSIIHQDAVCQFDNSNVTIETSGFPSEYSTKLKAKENIDAFTKALNLLKVPIDVAPIKIHINYEEGKITADLNYDHEKIFSEGSYWELTHDTLFYIIYDIEIGISVELPSRILTALARYQEAVSRSIYSDDYDIVELHIATKLIKENGDWLMFIGSTSITYEGWGHDFYVNCYMNIDENRYETYANNNEALNDYNYFIVRSPNLMGLDGKRTGAYYFCKFYNLQMTR